MLDEKGSSSCSFVFVHGPDLRLWIKGIRQPNWRDSDRRCPTITTKVNDELAGDVEVSTRESAQSNTNNGDPDAITTQISVNELYGYLPRGNLSFFIKSGWNVHAGPTAKGARSDASVRHRAV
jgi:hypothetical protein